MRKLALLALASAAVGALANPTGYIQNTSKTNLDVTYLDCTYSPPTPICKPPITLMLPAKSSAEVPLTSAKNPWLNIATITDVKTGHAQNFAASTCASWDLSPVVTVGLLQGGRDIITCTTGSYK